MFRKHLWSVLLILMLVAPGVLHAQNGDTFPVPPGRIVAGDEFGLFTIEADGTGFAYLAQDDDENCWLRDGAWSPDGSQLLYTRICGGGAPNNWRARTAEGNPDPSRTAQVFVYDTASRANTELIANGGLYQDYVGGWHPDGQRFVIFSNRENSIYNLYEVNFLTGETTPLTAFDYNVGHASFDNTGDFLLYNSLIEETDDVRWEVHAYNLQTNTSIRVAEGFTPNWSPDGQWIAYADNEDVYVMPTDCIRNNTGCNPSTAARNVTQTPGIPEREPIWSPDQAQLAYLRDTGTDPNAETWDIFRHDLATGQLQQLTNTPDVKERHSAWEPVAGVTPVAVENILPVILAVNSAQRVNLRSSPSTASNANIITTVDPGQILIGQAMNPARDWYKITLPGDGSPGWIFGNLVNVLEGDPTGLPEATE